MENRQSLSANDSRVKILVVDDHPNTATMLARAISRLGSHVEVVAATSGLEALQHAEDKVADILITDMMMPGMTGIELIEVLNDTPSITPPVTFLLTAHDSPGVRTLAKRLNVKDVIAKPAHPEEICELISQTISKMRRFEVSDPQADSQKPADTYAGTETGLEDLNIAQLIWEVAKKFQPHADVKNHLLVVGKTETDSNVRGNAAQLRQALRSLVWSAINSTPKGGTVMLSSESDMNMVKIIVRDTGYGTNGVNGNQINFHDLSVVKSIAEQHGGDIIFESEEGKGSCFTLSLPLFSSGNNVTFSNEKNPLDVNSERKTQ